MSDHTFEINVGISTDPIDDPNDHSIPTTP